MTKECWQTIEEVREDALQCPRCALCRTRKHVVFGDGQVPARLMVVGEGPGADEDEQGRPFVGRAGRLLDRVLVQAGIRRADAWVTNIVRCRPIARTVGAVRNRPPRSEEIKACDVWMIQEYRFVTPKVVVCLGATSAQVLIARGMRIGGGRGTWHTGRNGIPTIATYHPAYVLRLADKDRLEIEKRMIEDFRLAAERIAVDG